MLKLIKISAILLPLFYSTLLAALPTLEWDYELMMPDEYKQLSSTHAFETNDKHILLSGKAYNNTIKREDIIIKKIDSNGDIVSDFILRPTLSYEQDSVDVKFFYGVSGLSNGNFIALSKVRVWLQDSSFYCGVFTTFNSSGNILSESQIENDSTTNFYKAHPLTNGVFIFEDQVDYGSGSWDMTRFFMMDYKSNIIGNTNVMFAEHYNTINEVKYSSDNITLFCGLSEVGGLESGFVGKLNSSFNFMWKRTNTLSNSFFDETSFSNIIECSDNSILITGMFGDDSDAAGFDYTYKGAVYKYSGDGDLQWSRSIQIISKKDCFVSSIFELKNSNYVVFGSSDSKYFARTFSQDGSTIGDTVFTNRDFYISSNAFYGQNGSIYDPGKNTSSTGFELRKFSYPEVPILDYKAPASSNLKPFYSMSNKSIRFKLENQNLTLNSINIYNFRGALIYSKTLDKSKNRAMVSTPILASGMYIVNLGLLNNKKSIFTVMVH